jgi:type II secretory pathway pseudopilin PulG
MLRVQRESRGFTISELAAVMVIAALLVAMTLPAMGRARGISGVQQSMANLVTLHVAHASYSADHNGAQHVHWPHDLTAYGNNVTQAINNYTNLHGPPPTLWVGTNSCGSWFFTSVGAASYNLWVPIGFPGLEPMSDSAGFGAFRVMMSMQSFHAYMTGRFYDPLMYAPNDAAPWAAASPLFGLPGGFQIPPSQGCSSGPIYWSSYCLSPAALWHPDVMRANTQGGFQNPWLMNNGLTTPPRSAALYPDLKTHIIEHHWVQYDAPMCNPAWGGGTYNNCEPYYFNATLASQPVTLFYDGHVRLLPNTEAYGSDQVVFNQTAGVDGLWHRGTTFGANGYFHNMGFGGGPKVSHHVLTTDGIRGRDTLGPESALQAVASERTYITAPRRPTPWPFPQPDENILDVEEP